MTASPLTFHTASRRHLLVECEDLSATMALHRSLEAAALPGVVELVPAARTVLISFDPRRTGAGTLEEAIRGLERTDTSTVRPERSPSMSATTVRTSPRWPNSSPSPPPR